MSIMQHFIKTIKMKMKLTANTEKLFLLLKEVSLSILSTKT